MTSPKAEKKIESIDAEMIVAVSEALANGSGVRKTLPDKGRLNIDRPLPFLCVYRAPDGREDIGTAHLIMGEAAYLLAPNDAEPGLRPLVKAIAEALSAKYGAFLIIETWSAEKMPKTGFFSTASPTKFRIFTDKAPDALPSTVETLEESLEALAIRKEVELVTGEGFTPPGMEPLLDDEAIRKMSCLLLGIEVSPIYRDAETGELYRSILADLRRKFSNALQHTFFEFTHVQTSDRPKHPHTLGRRTMVDAVWEADAELAALSDKINYLFAVTPVNSNEAYDGFAERGFERDPVFHYRLLSFDPEDLKRQLYSISFESIEDPTVAYLLRDKRIELDRQITLIEDRNTPRFMYESLQLFPPVEDELMELAESILRLPKVPDNGSNGRLSADEIAKLGETEIDYYRSRYAEVNATVEVRKDTPPGMMVSSGNLMIGYGTEIAIGRVNGLLQHEVGTHIVTYFNGKSQPLKLLYGGLPGYEQLQEGLAVFAEYLVGELTLARLRTLAARVVAVRRLTLGHSFTEVFHELRDDHKFTDRTAFNVAMRVFRGGGLTKDAVYLRGLVEVVNYVRDGGDISTLLVGKMGFEHLPIIRELQWREVLKPSPLEPRYMTMPESAEQLQSIKDGTRIFDVI